MADGCQQRQILETCDTVGDEEEIGANKLASLRGSASVGQGVDELAAFSVSGIEIVDR